MSIFDNPFDPDRNLRTGCSCGRHLSEAEHRNAALALRCKAAESEDKRYASVVASAVLRAAFPQDATRRAFLKSVGAFDYSMHNYLLRYYLAAHGLDPELDVQIRAGPPPEMVANLRADNIDGFLGPDPMNQRAVYDGVGFIHILTKDIWEGHPCCASRPRRSSSRRCRTPMARS